MNLTHFTSQRLAALLEADYYWVPILIYFYDILLITSYINLVLVLLGDTKTERIPAALGYVNDNNNYYKV